MSWHLGRQEDRIVIQRRMLWTNNIFFVRKIRAGRRITQGNTDPLATWAITSCAGVTNMDINLVSPLTLCTLCKYGPECWPTCSSTARVLCLSVTNQQLLGRRTSGLWLVIWWRHGPLIGSEGAERTWVRDAACADHLMSCINSEANTFLPRWPGQSNVTGTSLSAANHRVWADNAVVTWHQVVTWRGPRHQVCRHKEGRHLCPVSPGEGKRKTLRCWNNGDPWLKRIPN